MATFNFGEANGTSLETIDANWAGDSTNLVTNTGLLQPDGGSSGYAVYRARYVNGHGAAQLSQAVVKAGAISALRALCLQDNGTNYYWSGPTSAQVVTLRRNGVYVDIGATTPNFTTDDVTLKLEITAGGVVTVAVNGSTVITYNDGSPLTGGYPGIYVVGDGTIANQRYDDWTDGVSSAATSLPIPRRKMALMSSHFR